MNKKAAGTCVPAAFLSNGDLFASAALEQAHQAAKCHETGDHGAAHDDNRHNQLVHAVTTFIL
ncbi:hypothetical protein [Pseudoduganella armeniaca]|uniref:hypothetical protein n=1 Tax=Pseudoduganella armeniaca TaxID=2072590 RepID=UPI0011B211C8|nr:hypothetical protein [Pseudoduganella armeniaca]